MSMTFGQKLRAARLHCGMTQNELAGGTITRNMLSQLENDQASPSIATLKYLSGKLNIPAGYFIEDVREFDARKLANIGSIRRMLSERDYEICESMCLELGSEEECCSDPEISLILAECRCHKADKAYRTGELTEARVLYESVLVLSRATVYDTSMYEAAATLRISIIDSIKNGGSPGCELPPYDLLSEFALDVKLWHSSEEPMTERHAEYLKAAEAFRNESYTEADAIYSSLFDRSEDLPTRFRLLTLLEECAAKSGDYEKAYGCSRRKQELLTKIK